MEKTLVLSVLTITTGSLNHEALSWRDRRTHAGHRAGSLVTLRPGHNQLHPGEAHSTTRGEPLDYRPGTLPRL